MNENRKRRPKRTRKRKIKKDFVLRTILGFVLLFVICFCVIRCTSGRKDYDDFLNDLGMRESSNRYDVENRYGYLGRYQMGALALQEAGFLDADGNWTDLANSYGVYSEEDFLQSPDGQDAAIRACHAKLCGYIKSYGLDEYVGTAYSGVTVTESGLLAACHLVGATSLKRALKNNDTVCDGNGVPASEYMELFSGYDISEVWNGMN